MCLHSQNHRGGRSRGGKCWLLAPDLQPGRLVGITLRRTGLSMLPQQMHGAGAPLAVSLREYEPLFMRTNGGEHKGRWRVACLWSRQAHHRGRALRAPPSVAVVCVEIHATTTSEQRASAESCVQSVCTREARWCGAALDYCEQPAPWGAGCGLESTGASRRFWPCCVRAPGTTLSRFPVMIEQNSHSGGDDGR